jgi:hypothetical protein
MQAVLPAAAAAAAAASVVYSFAGSYVAAAASTEPCAQGFGVHTKPKLQAFGSASVMT